ncbi:mycofactocin oligosaccharide methyltransferase MftM [Branchiibius sp. NY16-3462-2]|uniref:mycofactocin oligosaccharide methyltransferase MftM n=1 Tax=Branchiibius sp. NY16-3462-2 TaxID=1807500 RepID=UPI000795ECF0|nr:mycofactocin oligosaccharide methyltransferase MftM [Branchiibius sp. NY16-3462-2]KYH46112.1 hypothetical protein AZH51_10745 [Branchiibius sp. NY16-3462-2]
MTPAVQTPIDPFGPLVDGSYQDQLVTVTRQNCGRPAGGTLVALTAHFEVSARGQHLWVRHCLRDDEIDEDLTGLLQNQLFEPGWVRGGDLFERLFTGVVRSVDPDPLRAWELYYRNTIRRIDALLAAPHLLGRPRGGIADFVPVYHYALQRIVGREVVEAGACFGFLSLLAARRGLQVTAGDLSPGTVRLLDAMAGRLGVPLDTFCADAAALPFEDDSADTVLLIHLLEHLDDEHGARAIAEALRVARQRVVVAVPFEEEPDEAFGHLRTLSLVDLHGWGERTGCPFRTHEFHGGWLIIDQPDRGRQQPR